ncbi:MAG: hypothetical protein MRZ79_09050 [Bacteroidia bacterium]|nr:hypothetical protein [Bacteroidia bacterium]
METTNTVTPPEESNLLPNETYLDKLQKSLDEASRNKDQKGQIKAAASTNLNKAIAYRKSLDDYNGRLEATDKELSGLANSLKSTIRLAETSRTNIGFIQAAIQLLIGDTVEIAEETERMLAEVNDMKDSLKEIENSDDPKEKLDKVITANTEALTAALKALEDTLNSYESLKKIAVYFPNKGGGNIDGNVPKELSGLNQGINKMRKSLADTKGTYKELAGAVKIANEEEEKLETDLHNASDEYAAAVSTYEAINASLTAAKEANGG